jgi:hypothetical protein
MPLPHGFKPKNGRPSNGDARKTLPLNLEASTSRLVAVRWANRACETAGRGFSIRTSEIVVLKLTVSARWLLHIGFQRKVRGSLGAVFLGHNGKRLPTGHQRGDRVPAY